MISGRRRTKLGEELSQSHHCAFTGRRLSDQRLQWLVGGGGGRWSERRRRMPIKTKLAEDLFVQRFRSLRAIIERRWSGRWLIISGRRWRIVRGVGVG